MRQSLPLFWLQGTVKLTAVSYVKLLHHFHGYCLHWRDLFIPRQMVCVIGPCVGVQQAGTELCNPGSINPSELIHLSRILSRTSRYPYIIGGNNDRNSQEYKKQKQNRDAKTKVLHGFRRVSAAAHSIAVIPSSRNKLPSVQRLPLASSFLADLYQKVPRALW